MVKPNKEDLRGLLMNHALSGDEPAKAASPSAYAFFDCGASKRKLENELKAAKKLSKTPTELNLSLSEGIDTEKFYNPKLRGIAEEAKNAGIRYVMKGSYTGQGYSNKMVAGLLSGVLNQLYQSGLYRAGEQFRGIIVYENLQGNYLEVD